MYVWCLQRKNLKEDMIKSIFEKAIEKQHRKQKRQMQQEANSQTASMIINGKSIIGE